MELRRHSNVAPASPEKPHDGAVEFDGEEGIESMTGSPGPLLSSV